MSTIISANMGLTIPLIGSEPGPDYAYEINNNEGVIIDQHTHEPGKGVAVPVAGMNINDDFPLNINNVNNARSYRMNNSGVILNGGQDVNEIYTFNGNLYFNNSSGTPIKITNGSSINSTNTFYSVKTISANTTIAAADTFVYYRIDCALNTVNVNLPPANTVTAGRFYIFKDINGNSYNHNITITANGFDSIDSYSSKTFDRAFEVMTLVCDGAAGWHADFGADSSWLNNTFGQNGQATSIIGSSIGISADGAGSITLGSSTNILNFNGSSYSFGFNASNIFTINAATTAIRGEQLNVYSTNGSYFNTNVNLGDSSVDIITVNGSSAFTAPAFFGNTVIFNDDVTFNEDVTIGSASSDVLNVVSTTNLLNNVVVGTGISDLLTVNSTVNLLNDVTIGDSSSDSFQVNSTSRFYYPVTINDKLLNTISGRNVQRVTFNASTTSITYSILDASVFIVSGGLSANCTWTISNSGAVAGDMIVIYISGIYSATGSRTFFINNASAVNIYNTQALTTTPAQFYNNRTIFFNGTDWICPESPIPYPSSP